MTEQERPPAGAPEIPEAPKPPVPELPSSGAATSVDLDALASEVERRILPTVQKRADTFVMGRLRGASEEQLAQRLGVPVEKIRQAQREMALDEVAEERLSRPQPAAQAQPKKDLSERTGDLVGSLIREHAVQYTQTDLDALMKKRTYFSDQDWLSEVEADVKKRAKQNLPGAGATMGEGGSPPPPPPDLRGKYQQDLAKLRRGDARGLVALKNRYRKLGLTDI